MTGKVKSSKFAMLLNSVVTVVDLDPYWIRIQELCGSGSTHLRENLGYKDAKDINSQFRDLTDYKFLCDILFL